MPHTELPPDLEEMENILSIFVKQVRRGSLVDWQGAQGWGSRRGFFAMEKFPREICEMMSPVPIAAQLASRQKCVGVEYFVFLVPVVSVVS